MAVLAAETYEEQGDPRELFDAFLQARVYCQRPEQPGFIAVGEPPDAVIPVFSSLAELGAFAGETDYFSTTGRDVLDLLPQGYDLALDPAGDYPLRLDPAAWDLQVVVETGEDGPEAGAGPATGSGENGARHAE